jgi:hypothetical protein
MLNSSWDVSQVFLIQKIVVVEDVSSKNNNNNNFEDSIKKEPGLCIALHNHLCTFYESSKYLYELG